ncbi:MAG: SusC/RagA family TonB-linked outer membrane protein [Cytophagales bacterium]|nr:SusC/RagA family TonB-linked outer membrane protein [Cytophagales bacterium]
MSKLSFYGVIVNCILLGNLLAEDVGAQSVKSVHETFISIDEQFVNLGQVFEKIEDKTTFRFSYDRRKIFDDQAIITFKSEKNTVGEYLLEVSRQTKLKFKQINNTIHISKRNILTNNGLSVKVELQGIAITGKVISGEDQSGLPGANVFVKGTTQGTVTDIEGNYTLDVPDEESVLVFSSVGFISEEVTIGNQTVINITMIPDLTALEEIVIVGYGTKKKSDITGAVARADLETYESVPVTNILERVKGVVPGVNIEGTNRAGEVANIIIRGRNSTAASNAPLIVVDGAIYGGIGGSIADIAPNDIESFTVLKDASAAAIYGSRSSNGVILIETKRGEGKANGKPKFSLNMSGGLSQQLAPLELYDADSYMQRKLHGAQLLNPDATLEDDVIPFLGQQEALNYNATPDHAPSIPDPYGLIDQQGYSTNSTFSFSNRLEKSSYYVATTYERIKGVILNDDYKRIAMRVNINSDLTDWLNVSINSFYNRQDYSGASPEFWNSTVVSPYGSLYNEDGKTYRFYPQDWVGAPNPLTSFANEDLDIRNNLNSVVRARIKLPWIEGLTYNMTFSNALRWSNRNIFYDEFTERGNPVGGEGSRASSYSNYMLFDNIIKYDRTFSNKHSVNATLLYSQEKTIFEDMIATGRTFANAVLGTYKLENGEQQTVNTGGGETRGIGLMARASYSFDDRYTVTGTFRRDGYSAFSKNRKWADFPSVAMRWNIGKENFMEGVNFFDNISIRGSYGTNGNQSIAPYSSLATIATDVYQFYGPSSFTLTQFIDRLANDDLGWESTTGLNLGLDFSVLNSRLNVAFDVYKTNTNDLMFTLALPSVSGQESVLSNIGEIENTGVEIYLNSLIIDKDNFNWFSDFAFSLNRNKVVSILGEDNDGDGVEDDLVSEGFFIGEPLGTAYDFNVIGMWQQEDVENGTIMSGFRPGDYKFEDIDGDGAITSDKDRRILGNSEPNFRWSWTNTFEYKDFSLMAYIYSVWGGNNMYISGNNAPHLDYTAANTGANHPVYDYWTADNTGARFPRIDNWDIAPVRGRQYLDRSFIKLQKIALTYNASKLVKNWGIDNLRLVLSGDNILVYAPHWIGLDPETDSGLTFNSEPAMRTYYLSLAFNF